MMIIDSKCGITCGCFLVVLAWSPFYGFSPLGILHKVIGKLKANRAVCILLAPYWPRQFWFPTLWRLAKGVHRTLPSGGDFLHIGPVLHLEVHSLHMTLCLVLLS